MIDDVPFQLSPESADILTHSDGFKILRLHLADLYNYEFCPDHISTTPAAIPHWLLIRDVLHALLVPIVELFDKAQQVAHAADQLPDHPRSAFNGKARRAFFWIRDFLATETARDWCYTRGCPACVVRHSLSSASTVRLLHAACLLSDVHYPFTIDGPTLPSFMFFVDALERAVTADEAFGVSYFEAAQPEAVATRDGVEELIHQCLHLDAVFSRPPSPEWSRSSSPSPMGAAGKGLRAESKGRQIDVPSVPLSNLALAAVDKLPLAVVVNEITPE